MIIVDVFGGLGNQMFQYALGRHLAIKNGAPLTLRHMDVGAFSKRPYALGCFKLVSGVRVISKIENRRFKIFEKFWKLMGKIEEPIILEKGFPFDQQVLNLRGDIHLRGYWQSEKYFKDIRPIILEDFTFVKPLSRKNEKILAEIKRSNAVSVHVRRGDYVADPQTSKFHGVYGPDYYRKAVEIIAQKVKKPVFYFFSDDIEWVKNNIKTKYKNVYVDWNKGDKSYVDLHLMSHCRHHILANSSFSWWGAWLNQNRDKIVIAPKQWFQEKGVDTKDLIPEKWFKI